MIRTRSDEIITGDAAEGRGKASRAREGSGKVCRRESVAQPVILETSRDPAAHPEEEAADRNVVA